MQELTRITLELPTELIQETEKAIGQSPRYANAAGIVKSLSEFIAIALRHELSNLEQTSKFSSQLEDDPIWGLGTNPVVCDVTDASENLDRYLYGSL